MAAPEPMTGILREDIELIRGETPLLFDRQADAYYKIAPAMLDVLAFLTEPMPLDRFLELLNRNGIPVSREELLNLLSFLQQHNLLAPEYGHIGVKRERHAEMKEKTAFLRFSAAYLFFKLPPWRPERLFEKIGPYVSWLASRPVIVLLLIPAALGYLLIIRDFGNVYETFRDSLSWAGLAKYFVAILVMKFIHEAAHSLAAIHFKCRVRGIGLGFMVFYPRLYTDATDSWRLPRRQRLLIDSAGIIIELLIGGIAVLLWTYLPPGIWKSTMFYIFAVSTFNTLLVNGNPCIRYDGYYILCDLLNIENLMTRSSEHLKQSWRHYLLRLGPRPVNERGAFLLFFGVISFVYRIFLYTSIILIIYYKFTKAVAIVLVILELYSIVIYPCWREIQTVRALSRRSANRARWYLGSLLLFSGVLILFLPLSWSITLPAETVPAVRQLVTAPEGGYLTAPLPRRAVPVQQGAPLLQLESPLLDTAIKRLRGTLEYDRILHHLQQLDEKGFSESRVTAEKIASDRLSLEEMRRRRDDLTIRAGMDGIFVPELPSLSPGFFLRKGQRIGEVVSPGLMLYAYATDREIGKLRTGDEATVRLRDSLTGYPVRITAINRIAARLKNSPLLQHFGGPIPVYLEENTASGSYSSTQTLYRVELMFQDTPELKAGRVATVKIHHSEQLYTRLRQFLLSILRREF